jgi:hypothetical protein
MSIDMSFVTCWVCADLQFLWASLGEIFDIKTLVLIIIGREENGELGFPLEDTVGELDVTCARSSNLHDTSQINHLFAFVVKLQDEKYKLCYHRYITGRLVSLTNIFMRATCSTHLSLIYFTNPWHRFVLEKLIIILWRNASHFA